MNATLQARLLKPLPESDLNKKRGKLLNKITPIIDCKNTAV